MKRRTHWFNPIAIAVITSIAYITPTLANETIGATDTDYFQGQDSIELYVPEPQQNQLQIPSSGNVCAANLQPTIDRILGNYGSRWGILVESLQDKTVFYSHNADKYFIPASNNKILTTVAALQRLSPDTPIRSVTLKEWIAVTNLHSNNNYADTLMRFLGGPQAAKNALAQMGVNPQSFRMTDGSGLSRQNITTPRALVETLRAMYYAPGKEVFQASLPIAGVRGTLRNRMRQTPAQGMVYAKTGTLTGVRALSGYIYHPQYGPLVFSIIANNPSLPGNTLVRSIDNIVVQLVTLTPCN